MDDRRLRYEASHYWTPHKAMKRKKSREPYGSVSAHSTSAIYGALRAPQYHALYGPSNMWYASVRSLNRECPRDVIYTTETPYDWNAYKTKNVFPTGPPVPVNQVPVPVNPACVCRQFKPKCKYCFSYPPRTKSQSTSKPPVENIDPQPELSSRMSAYKKCVSSKHFPIYNKGTTKDFGNIGRKSILACDVTAYDLIKKIAPSDIDDNDIDDNLNDNAIALKNKIGQQQPVVSGLAREIVNQNQQQTFKKSQSENCIYSETCSVLVGGQRIITDRSPDISSGKNSGSTKWLSVSDDSICIPDPDYDFSDESDVENGSMYRHPKFTYSPPTIRKSNFTQKKELSKSMSSLLSDDTYVPSIILNPDECVIRENHSVSNFNQNDRLKMNCESSSDCSSSGGTISSEYPTWTSNELKSILKKKKRLAIQEQEDNVFQNIQQTKEKKKQVQFLSGGDAKIFDSISLNDTDTETRNCDGSSTCEETLNSVINCDTYDTIPEDWIKTEDDGKDDHLGSKGNSESFVREAFRSNRRSSSLEDVRPSTDLSSGSLSDDDVPSRKARSLPESLSQLSFFLDFLPSKDKIPSRSKFYVPVKKKDEIQLPDVGDSELDFKVEKSFSLKKSPSIGENCNHSVPQRFGELAEDNVLSDHYDTDDDILENDYEHLDPIYEELNDVSYPPKRLTSLESKEKSFFEGASKIDILSYLEDAKERGISEALSEDVIIEEDEKSGEEDDEKQSVITRNDLNHEEVLLTIEKQVCNKIDEPEDESKIREVERNDSGVGTETSKPSRLIQLPNGEQLCADCEAEPVEDSPLVCKKCQVRRCERKEIIIEFVDTELKYGRDLRIIKDEFYRPMEIAGLLAKDQLLSIFLNLEELISDNKKFSEKLQDALDIAMELGDEDYTTVNLGKIFLESSSMLHAFEAYCIKQAPASVILSSLEKEKELLRIFLKVSQMENTLLRRMNLPAFLMVPVQRVTRYPLLLSRLHKVTPIHHKDRGALKEAQQKVQLHLQHINTQTKGVGGTKIWRRISNISASHRRLGKDIGSIHLRKMALEILNWKQDETRFVMAGKLLFTAITDYPWNRKGRTIKFTCVHALLIALGKPNSNYRLDCSDNVILFPRNTGIRDACLVLMKEKNGRFVAVREPLYLGNCVISCESENDDVFEVQEYTNKDSYLMKGDSKKETKEWLSMLRYHAKDLGSWRKRRNALANIMINGMIRQ